MLASDVLFDVKTPANRCEMVRVVSGFEFDLSMCAVPPDHSTHGRTLVAAQAIRNFTQQTIVIVQASVLPRVFTEAPRPWQPPPPPAASASGGACRRPSAAGSPGLSGPPGT